MAPTLPAFTLPQAVAETFIIGLFYGLYLVTACYANRWLFFAEGWKLRKNIHWFMAVTTNLLAAMLLVSTALVLRDPIDQSTFVEKGHTPEEYVAPDWDTTVKCIIANLIALVADIVLVYRLWVVYGRKLGVVYFPAFLWVSGIVCTVLQGYLQAKHIHDPNFDPYQWASVNMNVGPGIALIPFWGSTVILNAYSTGLLIWRIRQASKKGENVTVVKQLRHLLRILMESGVLYLAISIAHFFVWFGQDNFAIHVIGGLNSIVMTIAFNLILIRTAQNRAEGEEIKYDGVGMSAMHFKSKPMMISAEYQNSLDTEPTVYPSSSHHNV
ncbi:hypothetical protein P691DRAFT_764843 [Macrolepiota fuliginosa MF-IS2]|uniref:Uncharacterized protein n=1 Tax=Macrolepiota fuliginosa MF-IS2 TaxID=1400762 RepID=A0A9P5X209_9AGAR|nr:hypothetical protein P691DRAFT_764843 [Macrolepiota fuliginosa MF-IS2]